MKKSPRREGASFEEKGNSGVAQSLSRKIRTVADLLDYAGVDLSIWEVERHSINKWETAAKWRDQNLKWDKAGVMVGHAKRKNEFLIQPLFQIKVWLKRKAAPVRAAQSLLEEISRKAKPTPAALVRHSRTANGRVARAFELCVMDPHIGLLCQAPEADAPWNLEIASETVMAAIDNLIEKAKPFGPFEQAFMPFGNDFIHSDDVFHRTTAGTGQPEAIAWHHVYVEAQKIAIAMIERLRKIARNVFVYEVPGNHSRMGDFTMARLLQAYFRNCAGVKVDASSSPYKFHRFGVNLIGYEHGHSVAPIRLAALMANERPKDWAETEYREFHLGDQHRKGSAKPSALEEQGVSVEYIPGLTAPNEWHRLKAFSHQKRGAMAYVWDAKSGPVARFQFNISQYSHAPLK